MSLPSFFDWGFLPAPFLLLKLWQKIGSGDTSFKAILSLLYSFLNLTEIYIRLPGTKEACAKGKEKCVRMLHLFVTP
jgi:hypothetical protein